MKKENLLKQINDDQQLVELYQRIPDADERDRVKSLAAEALADMCDAFGPLLESLESPEVKEQIAKELTTLLSGSRL